MASEDQILRALDKFEQKIDSLDSRLDSVDKTLVKQEANLGEHMRRTEIAETAIEKLSNKIAPLEKHKAFMEGALKGFGLLAMAVSFAAGIIKIVSFFHL